MKVVWKRKVGNRVRPAHAFIDEMPACRRGPEVIDEPAVGKTTHGRPEGLLCVYCEGAVRKLEEA